MALEMETDLPDEDAPFTPQDDYYHVPPNDDPFHVETNWWSFNVPELRLGGWFHCLHHVNRRACSWRVFAWDATSSDPDHLAYYKSVEMAPMPPDPDLTDVTFPSGGFSLKMIEPLMTYDVTYEDPAAGFAVELRHRSVHPPHRFTPGEAPMMANPHLDQLGHVTGTLTLRGESVPIDCHSLRDRTWGPRGGHHESSTKAEYQRGEYRVLHPGGPRWREIERQRGRGRIQYVFGHADETTGFMGFLRPQDGDAEGWSPVHVGWLLRDADFRRLDKHESRMRVYRDPDTGLTSHMELELTDRSGREMRVEGAAVSRIAERRGGGHSLMRWDIDQKIGWGEDQDVWKRDHFDDMVAALRELR